MANRLKEFINLTRTVSIKKIEHKLNEKREDNIQNKTFPEQPFSIIGGFAFSIHNIRNPLSLSTKD